MSDQTYDFLGLIILSNFQSAHYIVLLQWKNSEDQLKVVSIIFTLCSSSSDSPACSIIIGDRMNVMIYSSDQNEFHLFSSHHDLYIISSPFQRECFFSFVEALLVYQNPNVTVPF